VVLAARLGVQLYLPIQQKAQQQQQQEQPEEVLAQ
jgi:hypothetical protein